MGYSCHLPVALDNASKPIGKQTDHGRRDSPQGFIPFQSFKLSIAMLMFDAPERPLKILLR